MSYEETKACLQDISDKLHITATTDVHDVIHKPKPPAPADNPADTALLKQAKALQSDAEFKLLTSVSLAVLTACAFFNAKNFNIRVVQVVLPRVATQLNDMTNLLQKGQPSMKQVLDALQDIQTIRGDLNLLLNESRARRAELRSGQSAHLAAALFSGMSLANIGWAFLTMNPVAGASAVAVAAAEAAAKAAFGRAALCAGGAVLLNAGCWYFAKWQIDSLEALDDKIHVELENLLDMEKSLRKVRDALPAQQPVAAANTPVVPGSAGVAA